MNRPGFPRRVLVALLVAVCVLAGQSGVATHALGHALEGLAVTAHEGQPAGGVAGSPDCDEEEGERGDCPLHALYAELASLAVGAWPGVAAQAAIPGNAAFSDAPAFRAPRVAFRSRAPPVLPA